MTTTPDSSNFPESVSIKDLEGYMETAKEEKNEPTYDGLTRSELEDLVKETLDAFDEKCEHPIAQKVVCMTILSNMIAWHTHVGSEDEDRVSRIAWLRDAGKFQAAMAILAGIECAEDDFTCNY